MPDKDKWKQVIEAVKLAHEDGKSEGIIVCPRCRGIIRYTKISYNGHIWGKCETENCLSWMQ